MGARDFALRVEEPELPKCELCRTPTVPSCPMDQTVNLWTKLPYDCERRNVPTVPSCPMDQICFHGSPTLNAVNILVREQAGVFSNEYSQTTIIVMSAPSIMVARTALAGGLEDLASHISPFLFPRLSIAGRT